MQGQFDWPGLMRAGLQILRLRPDQFWALTPVELQLMMGHGARPAMDRKRLLELAKLWPDQGPTLDAGAEAAPSAGFAPQSAGSGDRHGEAAARRAAPDPAPEAADEFGSEAGDKEGAG